MNTAYRSRSRRQREVVVLWEKMILLGLCLLAAALLALAVAGHIAGLKASDRSKASDLHCSYTSVEVEEGDTLWSLARRSTAGTDIPVSDCVSQISRLNHIAQDRLTSGAYVIVPLYSREHTPGN